MSIKSERTNELRHIVGNVSMRPDFVTEQFILFLRGKVPVDLGLEVTDGVIYEEVGRFKKIRLFGEFFNCITSVSENTLHAVDVGDFTCDCGGIHVRSIQHTETSGRVILVTFLESD